METLHPELVSTMYDEITNLSEHDFMIFCDNLLQQMENDVSDVFGNNQRAGDWIRFVLRAQD
jgi:hypothetical protein